MKQDNENKDYEMKRERAQKIAFAKIRELMQRNVSKNSNKTFQQYTKDLIKQYLASPSSKYILAESTIDTAALCFKLSASLSTNSLLSIINFNSL